MRLFTLILLVLLLLTLLLAASPMAHAEGADRCRATLPGGWICMLRSGHGGAHLWARGGGPEPNEPIVVERTER